MSSLTLYYKRTGSWPAFTPAQFSVTSEHPNPKLLIERHGYLDKLPGPRNTWLSIDLPVAELHGREALASALDLLSPSHTDTRIGVLIADAISLYRAICQHLGWDDSFPPSPWVAALPDTAVLQRGAIEKACAA
jgi:hypothetical protein